jgi:predicted adenylyl cyclase CyaB
MATNVEIKARIKNLLLLKERAEALSERPAELIIQEDIFFHVPSGRLKLRILAPDQGQLILYYREDAAGPKRSEYFISLTAEPDTLRNVLAKALGVRGIVRKKRWLYWVGNTRIHLDEVEGLGDFLELEVVLEDGQSTEEGEAIAFDLMSALGVIERDLVQGAYIDLLEY